MNLFQTKKDRNINELIKTAVDNILSSIAEQKIIG